MSNGQSERLLSLLIEPFDFGILIPGLQVNFSQCVVIQSLTASFLGSQGFSLKSQNFVSVLSAHVDLMNGENITDSLLSRRVYGYCHNAQGLSRSRQAFLLDQSLWGPLIEVNAGGPTAYDDKGEPTEFEGTFYRYGLLPHVVFAIGAKYVEFGLNPYIAGANDRDFVNNLVAEDFGLKPIPFSAGEDAKGKKMNKEQKAVGKVDVDRLRLKLTAADKLYRDARSAGEIFADCAEDMRRGFERVNAREFLSVSAPALRRHVDELENEAMRRIGQEDVDEGRVHFDTSTQTGFGIETTEGGL
jgi:hypothetical protein